MKANAMMLPIHCEVLSEEKSKEVYGGVPVFSIVTTIVGLVWNYGYPTAGRYAKKVWPTKIPTAAKLALMAAFPDPIGWSQFMKGYNGK